MNIKTFLKSFIILIVSLFLCVLLSPVHIIEAEDPEESEDVPPCTYIDEEIEGENLLHTSFLTMASSNKEDSYYNLNEEGYVTSVKNQDPYGDCWAFSIVASAESTYLKQTGISLDLSELHLAYYAYHNYLKSDPLNMITNDGALTSLGIVQRGISYYESSLDIGGNNEFATALLSSGAGFVRERDVPYKDAIRMKDADNTLCYTRKYLLEKAEWYSMAKSEQAILKKAIRDNGAVATAFYWDSGCYNAETKAYYIDNKTSSNHAIAIVGYDDHYAKENFNNEPEGDGAWIIKNSWGSSWGEGGYFYISYYDTSLNKVDRLACQVFIKPAALDEEIVEHDGGTMLNKAVSQSNCVYEASIFTSERDELLTSVAYFTGQANTTVTVSIYKDIQDGPTNGNKVYEQSIREANAGFHTLKLNEDIVLNEDDVYSIVVRYYKFNVEEITTYLDISYDGTAKMSTYFYSDVSAGDSYYSLDGVEWSDYASLIENKPANARIKGYTSSLSNADFYEGELTIEITEDYDSFFQKITAVYVNETEIPVSSVLLDNTNHILSIDEATLVEYGLEKGNVHLEVKAKGFNSIYFEDIYINPVRKRVPEYTLNDNNGALEITSEDTDWMEGLVKERTAGKNIILSYRDIKVEFDDNDFVLSADHKTLTITKEVLQEKLPGINNRKYKLTLSSYGYESKADHYTTSGLEKKEGDIIYIKVNGNGGVFTNQKETKVFAVIRGESFKEAPVKDGFVFVQYRYSDGRVFESEKVDTGKDIELFAYYKGLEQIQIVNTSVAKTK